MEREKIVSAAKEAIIASAETLTTFGTHSSIDDAVAAIDIRLSYDEVAESAFEKACEWLMTQPLFERLTEDEKKEIRKKYQYCERYIEHNLEAGLASFDTCMTLEAIFGKELFKQKGE